MPAELRPLMQAEALGVPDTDWHVDRLYDFVRARGVTLMAATHSRYVIDLNRDPDGGVLYPGASNTELCPTTRFDGGPVWKDGPPAICCSTWRRAAASTSTPTTPSWPPNWRACRRAMAMPCCWTGTPSFRTARAFRRQAARPQPGHRRRRQLPARPAAGGRAGLAGGRLHRGGQRTLQGGWITRHYGRPAEGYHALQLEMALSAYMTEQAPFHWQPERAEPLRQVLETLVAALLAWRAA